MKGIKTQVGEEVETKVWKTAASLFSNHVDYQVSTSTRDLDALLIELRLMVSSKIKRNL